MGPLMNTPRLTVHWQSYCPQLALVGILQLNLPPL